MIIARVFPRRTNAAPDDGLTFFDAPPRFLPHIDAVYVSVAFTYDMERAERLAEAWAKTGLPVKMGGPAFDEPGGNFVPGLFLRKGFVITSRGCPNRCPFCAVPRREGGKLRELPIESGFNIVDDNLLACSEAHIKAVFDMLKRQRERPVFSGGLEAKRLRQWHVDLLRAANTDRFYCAYDTADDLEPLIEAGKLLRANGITIETRQPRAYVLIGYRGDTFDAAERRLRETWQAGFIPFSMLFRGETGETSREWRKFQRAWVRPAIIFSNMREDKNALL